MSADIKPVASRAAREHLRWAMTPEIGPVLFARIVESFGSAGAALGTAAAQLSQIEGISPTGAQRMARARDVADVDAEVNLAGEHGVRIICREDEEYPPGLKHIPDPPICLYVKGCIDRQDAVALGMVGSRRCTIYGREQARRFGQQIASRGITVVSGLARGVDGEAHKGALESGGRTIAVLGNGLSAIYPPEHVQLAEQVVQSGAIISELPMTASPDAKNFLPRNRIIAGMTLGVLVIEAARRSGSLTTARMASEYNREVFAIPGRIDSEFSRGTNAMIRDQHAKLITSIEDIVEELGAVGEVLEPGTSQAEVESPVLAAARAQMSDAERQIMDALDREGQSIEAVADSTDQPPSRVASLLVGLQLKGLVRQLPGNQFIRTGTGA